ncbi:MAG: bifunctional diaminohydroxyphosphoribosylaminopyrimidine deaminase/5-amino-6-(5-phosphoribosylamino)uracil reductase RibD [Candidatus Omnitrophota bacterium]
MKDDASKYMHLALRLAQRGRDKVSPNPMVGAVVVKKGKIIGRGYHKFFGGPHAEIYALRQAGLLDSKAGKNARGATLYVTFEPCNHYGKTPPCTGAIVKAGIKKVVIAMKDPNPLNNGAGIRELRRKKIRVVSGVCEKQAKRLNSAFIKYITEKMPYVIVKIAQSLDGKIATKKGESKWITRDYARRHVQKLRAEADAIMIGVNTILKDDPLLTARNQKTKINRQKPVKVILDSKLRTPLNAKIFSKESPAKVIIAANSAPKEKIAAFKNKGVEIIEAKGANGNVNIKTVMRELARRGIANVLIEGGGETIASAFKARLVDKILFFIAPKIIGGRCAKTSVEGEGIEKLVDTTEISEIKIKKLDKDILLEGYVHGNN